MTLATGGVVTAGGEVVIGRTVCCVVPRMDGLLAGRAVADETQEDAP